MPIWLPSPIAVHRQVDDQVKRPIPGSPWGGRFALSLGRAPNDSRRSGGRSSVRSSGRRCRRNTESSAVGSWTVALTMR